MNSEENFRASEEKYRNLFKNSPNGIIIIDINGIIIDCNAAATKISGYTKDDLIGKNYLEIPFYSEKNKKKLLSRFYEHNKNRNPAPLELEIIQKDGRVKWVKIQSSLFKVGAEDYVQAIFQDITKQKIAEQKLIESEEKFRIISDQSMIGIGILQDNNIKYINEATAKINGFTVEEMMGWTIEDLAARIHPEDRKFAIAQARKKQEGNPDIILNYTYRIFTKSNKLKWIEQFSKTITYEGRPAVLSVAVDITEKVLAEQNLSESEEKYREAYSRANLYKDLFAHDINNILQNINSSIDLSTILLEQPEKLEDIKELFEIIKEQVIRGSELVKNVQRISQIDDHKEFAVKPIDATERLQKSIEFVKQSLPMKDITVRTQNESEIPLILGNSLVGDIFDNILFNAIRHNRSSNIEIQIKITDVLENGQNFIKTEFIDNGIGIPDSRKKIIFEQGSKSRKNENGMGLGLSLVKKILDIYHGKIWVEDKVPGDYNKGTNIVMMFPK